MLCPGNVDTSPEIRYNKKPLLPADTKGNTKAQYSSQINANISEIGSKLDEIDASLEKYRLSTEYQNITAPVSGYVNSIGVNTLGETVTSAQQLVTIVPDNTPNEMICYVKNTDISSYNKILFYVV